MGFIEFLNIENIHFLIAIFISGINALLLVLVSKKFLQILQISGYKIRGYQVWLADTKAKYISRIAMLCFLSLACVLVTNALFDVYNKATSFAYFGLIFYAYFSIVFIINMVKLPQKTPLVQTRRMSRITTLLYIICFIISFLLIWLSTIYFPFLRVGIIVLTPILLPILVPLVHFLLVPLESMIRRNYVRRAKNKLAKRPDLIKIGITGSFGKTSVKHILNIMLSEKYNVCMSPHSFNTPMGLTKVVLNYLKSENDVLIAEMGARQVGDISFLCQLIEPHHGIITGVGTQHYLTFGSKENISKTKNELVLSLPQDAHIIFNGDSKGSQILYNACSLKNKYVVSLNKKSEISAEDVNFSKNGIEFNLKYKDSSVKCKTCLLGRHNLSNILLSACLAIKLGVSLESIKKAINQLEPISHRLQPIYNGNITILDNAYSSNEEGAKISLEVLGLYENYTKICVTPGLVELGEEEAKVNISFGKQLAKVCDYVIIVNKVNAESLQKGLISSKFDEDNLFLVENLDEAKQKLKKIIGSKGKYVVLFENDLPDNYT
ncbi:MAG: UDP-N-acetylmuramoyl-tripeptide--D-alanyl-D-alanine ligase [Clostridia bacterium]|nr:UDP-N-acetylmuramoyl-tripeptide--D-alanyl-D-alanine ligase [Clostridia bacterium]MDD4685747.1 UDP-N-acetylmuramoyl-tripeptide--D-alanyl-D-alanine ligase [Clostridia bacterium]